MNAQEATTAERAVHYPRRIEGEPDYIWKERRQDYTAKIAAIRLKWQDWMWEEYGYDLPITVRGDIFEKAWEDGHSSGLYSVESIFENLCDFTRKVRAA